MAPRSRRCGPTRNSSRPASSTARACRIYKTVLRVISGNKKEVDVTRLTSIAIAISASIALAPAIAAELTGPEIKDMLSGKTVYLETAPGSVTGTAGQGVIYY